MLPLTVKLWTLSLAERLPTADEDESYWPDESYWLARCEGFAVLDPTGA